MVECSWALVCDYGLTATDGKVSAIGIFDVLWVKTLPVIYPRLSLVARFIGSPHEVFPIGAELIRPNNEVVGSGNKEGRIGWTASSSS